MSKLQTMMKRYAAYNRVREAMEAEGLTVDPMHDKCSCTEGEDADGGSRSWWGPLFYRALEACGLEPKKVGAAMDRRLDRDDKELAFERRDQTCFYVHDFLEAAVDVMTASNSSEA